MSGVITTGHIMAQIIQSATDTFSNQYSLTTTKTVTFPTALTSTSNVQIVATAQRSFKASSLRNLISVTYDAASLTTTGVTFTAIVDKGYVGVTKFDYIVIENT